jgi:DNA-binding NarL/FixJ family response regulator
MRPDPEGAVRVMIVDDHPIWREGTARYLTEAGYQVAATAGDGAQAVRIVAAARPDVVLLDLNLPDQPGAEVTGRLLAAYPPARILMLSASGERDDVLGAVTAGAVGYLLKSVPLDELVAGVRAAAHGQAVFTPGLAGLVLGEYRRMSRPAATVAAGPALTARETEVLRLVAVGLTYPQIAARLTLSVRTVQNHVQNTLAKLHLHNKAQLVRYALENDVTGGDDGAG